jgi:FkbM family methyltransferase
MSFPKLIARSLLNRIRVYERLRASYLYDLVCIATHSEAVSQRNSEVRFYSDLLTGFQKGDLVFDIGANHGCKTEVFLRLGARVVAVDPDESNEKVIEDRFLKYRIKKKPVAVVKKAVSDTNGLDTLWIYRPGAARNTLNPKWVRILESDPKRFGKQFDFANSVTVETTTLDRLISIYGAPFFIKIDTEGHEINVLRGLSQPVPFLSFEVNLPEFRDEGLACIDLLEQLVPEGTFNYSIGDRPALVSKSWIVAEDLRKTLSKNDQKPVEVFWRSAGYSSNLR